MNLQVQKHEAARAAIDRLLPGSILGVGSGSTVDLFISELARVKARVRAAVAASTGSERALRKLGIQVLELNDVVEIELYIDGADEITDSLAMIKGGGGALTREKIIASASRTFVCIADSSKRVETLGRFPLPVEVVPMARSFVARRIVALGGTPELRIGTLTDNGNVILDVRDLDLNDPLEMESTLNQIPGIVCNGLFAQRKADLLLLGTDSGVQQYPRSSI